MGIPHASPSTLTLDFQIGKVVGGGLFLALGCTSVRVKYCDPTLDLGKVTIHYARNCIGPKLKSLK